MPVTDMCLLRSAKIIHDIIHRADYIFLSEFLRCIGVFIHEEILLEPGNDKTQIEQNTHYSICIYIGEKKLSEENECILEPIVSKEEYERLTDNLSDDTVMFYEEDVAPISPIFQRLNKNEQVSYLKSVTERILNKLPKSEGENQQYCFEDIIRVYVNNELFLHSINMQYFPKKSRPFIETAKHAFIEAYRELDKLGSMGDYDRTMRAHYLYALLWTKVKGNIACNYLEDILYFSEDKMISECRLLIEMYPDFSNAKVLLGLCYEPMKKKSREMLEAFGNVLPNIKKESFSASVYYWMGKKYEVDVRNPEYMKEYYMRSNNVSVKFRSLFKLGIIARNEKRYDTAIMYFDTILRKLELKDKISFTDPLELEYMQKAYIQKSITYSEKHEAGNVGKNIEMARTAKSRIEDNKLFAILYSEDQEEYRKESRERINIGQFEQMLKGAL